MGINDRFTNLDLGKTPGISGFGGATVPQVLYQSGASTATSSTTVAYPTGVLTIPKGTIKTNSAFRVIMSGTKTNANDAMSVTLYLKDAAILTMASPAATAASWIVEMTVVCSAGNAQTAFGKLLAQALAVVVGNSTATKDTTADVVLKAGIAAVNGSDTVTCNYVRVEFLAAM